MKRITAAFLVLVIFVLSIAVSAEELERLAFVTPGLSIDTEGVFLPEEGEGVQVFPLKAGMFSCGGDVLRRRIVSVGDVSALSITLPTDTLSDEGSYDIHGYTEASFILTGVEGDFSALCFGISIGGVYGHEYDVHLTLSSESGDITSDFSFTPSEWNLACLDIAGASGQEYLLTVRVTYSENDMPSTISISSPYLLREYPVGFTYSEKYLATEFETLVGTFSPDSGNATPDERGDVIIFADLVTTEVYAKDTSAVFEIELSGVNGGFLSLGIRVEGDSENEYTYTSALPLSADDGIYAFPITLDGELISYSLDFIDVDCTGFFKIDKVKIHGGGDVPISTRDDIGFVKNIRLSYGAVSFSGSMERWAVSEFSDSGIRYFAIPVTTRGDLGTAIEIGRTSTTTIFEYTMDLSAYPQAEYMYMFFAGVYTEDGELLPISSPRFAQKNDTVGSTLSNMGLHNASAAGAFESNVSHIILDVDLASLIVDSTAANASVITYFSGEGTKNVGISRENIKSLDKDIEFYKSAGINVYLRLVATSPVEGLTYGGDEYKYYSVNAKSEDSLALWASIVRFVAERYDGASGISVGGAVNSPYTVGDADIFDIYTYAEEISTLMRITYNAAVSANPDAMILVEFDEYRDSDSSVSDKILATAISKTLSDMGTIPWAFVYSIDSAEDSLSSPISLCESLNVLEMDGPSAVMYFYDPMSDNLTHKYSLYLDSLDRNAFPTPPTFAEYLAMTFGGLCERGAEVGATAVFMSLGDILQSTDHEFYASVKNTGLGSDRYIADFDAKEASGVVEGAYGVYVLSDFTDKHHSLDWISGGGVSSFTTEHSTVFSDAYGRYSRVLRSSVDTVGVAGAAGLILRNLRGTTDLADTKVVFDFSVHGDVAEEDLTVVFVFGADDNRAEFDAGKVVLGEACTLVCDLGEYEYASAVDYIGVMIYSENSVNFDISKVTVCSDTKTADELNELFNPTDDAVTGALDKYVIGVVIFIVAVISIVGCILILRRDREDSETAEGKNDRRNSNGRQK